MLNKARCTAMKTYYNTKSVEYKHNTKKLWQLLNQTVNKCKSRGSIIPYVTINGLHTYYLKKIANSFGKFYSELGSSLASTISRGTKTIDHYLNAIQQEPNSCVLRRTTQLEICNLIAKLPSKTSTGHDQIGNVLLKQLNESISYPLELIFNCSIAEGTFPEMMKKAEVIPLYKGKEQDIIINYHPISLLMTISKILEKIVYSRLYSFLEKKSILYESQYGFKSKRSCEQVVSELLGRILQAAYYLKKVIKNVRVTIF